MAMTDSILATVLVGLSALSCQFSSSGVVRLAEFLPVRPCSH